MRQIKTEMHRAQLVRDIMAEALPFRVEIRTGERTLDQNALSHVWYGEIARQDRAYSVDQVRCLCKLHIGVPLMRSASEEFRERWDRLIKPRFQYAEKLELMVWFPVTSLMDKHQMRDYLTAMQAYWAGHGISLHGLDPGPEDYPEAHRA